MKIRKISTFYIFRLKVWNYKNLRIFFLEKITKRKNIDRLSLDASILSAFSLFNAHPTATAATFMMPVVCVWRMFESVVHVNIHMWLIESPRLCVTSGLSGFWRSFIANTTVFVAAIVLVHSFSNFAFRFRFEFSFFFSLKFRFQPTCHRFSPPL